MYRGVKIFKPNGELFDHKVEWGDAVKTFKNTMNQYRFYSENDQSIWKEVRGKTNEIWGEYKKYHNKDKLASGIKPNKGI